MNPPQDSGTLRLALPKGRMFEGVAGLLGDAGLRLHSGRREYRPRISEPGFDVKILKPQSIVEMLHAGARDLGFAGADWVAEQGVDLVELLDTGLDPVRLVAAAPPELIDADGALPPRTLVVASEYPRLAARWAEARGIDATLLRSYGATEVLPPEDADVVVDNTATGATLAAHGLTIFDTLMSSSTRLYAHPAALADSPRRDLVERVLMLLRGVLEARARVMLEVNVTAERLESLCAILPCMREPTIAPLHGGVGFAVKVAAPRAALPRLLSRIQEAGGTDIVVTPVAMIVP